MVRSAARLSILAKDLQRISLHDTFDALGVLVRVPMIVAAVVAVTVAAIAAEIVAEIAIEIAVAVPIVAIPVAVEVLMAAAVAIVRRESLMPRTETTTAMTAAVCQRTET